MLFIKWLTQFHDDQRFLSHCFKCSNWIKKKKEVIVIPVYMLAVASPFSDNMQNMVLFRSHLELYYIIYYITQECAHHVIAMIGNRTEFKGHHISGVYGSKRNWEWFKRQQEVKIHIV